MDETPAVKPRLPRWALRDGVRQFTEGKLAPYRSMLPAQRAQLMEVVCHAALQQAMLQADPSRVLRYRAPISKDTERLLKRLRDEYRARGQRS